MSTAQHLTAAAAADHFGVSERTIWRWIKAGKLATIRPTPGRTILVVIED